MGSAATAGMRQSIQALQRGLFLHGVDGEQKRFCQALASGLHSTAAWVQQEVILQNRACRGVSEQDCDFDWEEDTFEGEEEEEYY